MVWNISIRECECTYDTNGAYYVDSVKNEERRKKATRNCVKKELHNVCNWKSFCFVWQKALSLSPSPFSFSHQRCFPTSFFFSQFVRDWSIYGLLPSIQNRPFAHLIFIPPNQNAAVLDRCLIWRKSERRSLICSSISPCSHNDGPGSPKDP